MKFKKITNYKNFLCNYKFDEIIKIEARIQAGPICRIYIIYE